MPQFKVLTAAFRPGGIVAPGTVIDYDGPPSWNLEPVDPKARALWLKETADFERVRETLRKAGAGFDDHVITGA